MSIQRVTAFLALLICLPLWAEQWEGNAARIRPGEFTTPGFFAASNSFPEGSRIRVSSSRTGKSVEVTVSRRIDGTTGIFLLLSDQAADALGLLSGDTERVVASPVTMLPQSAYNPPLSTTDPDDPRTGLAALKEELRAAGGQPAGRPPAQVTQAAPPPTAAPPAAPGLGEAVTREPQKQLFIPPQAAAAPPAVAQAPEKPPEPQAPKPAEGLQQYVERSPQKQLFLPPREEEMAVTPPPPQPQVVTAPPALQEPAQPQVVQAPEASDAPPAVAQAQLVQPPLASPEPPPEAAAATAEATPQTPQPASPAPASVAVQEPAFPLASEGSLAARPPASAPPVAGLADAPQPAPPQEKPREAVAAAPAQGPAPAPAAAAPAPAALSAPAAAPRGTFFVQLGAFSDEASARELERRFRATYPVDVQTGARNGRSYFRVVVGPLGRDETGSTLLRFQSLGFRDAFVRAVN